MANVPLTTRFIGISENVNLTERKSAVLNAETQPFTMQDIVDTAGGDSILKAVQVTITEAEILNASGFSELLVSAVTGKTLVPVSLSAFRKVGGTAYTIGNSVRLFSSSNAGSSSVGNGTLDAVFQSATPATTIAPVSTTNFSLITGNTLHVASGSLVSPSVITGGTGDLIVIITYTEVDTI